LLVTPCPTATQPTVKDIAGRQQAFLNLVAFVQFRDRRFRADTDFQQACCISAPGCGYYAASRCRSAALIIAAPFSAIMVVGALVLVELTAGVDHAQPIEPPPTMM
jgi:hypothetical protein